MIKKRIFMVAVILSATLCWSVENPGIRNPVGSITLPPSTFRSGTVSNPSPIDNNGNLLITGNVRRGRHFRGDVPYRSATSFNSNLGSSSLNSFLRDTAGSEDIRTQSNKYGTQPYYLKSGTVTTMMPGRSGIFRPASTRASASAQQDNSFTGAGVSGPEFETKEQSLFSQVTAPANSNSQKPIAQYGPLAQARLMLQSKFPTNVSLHPRKRDELKQAQGDSSSIELFKEQVQDIKNRTQNTRAVPNQQQNIGNLRQKYDVQQPAQNISGEGKQTVSSRYSLPALQEFKSSEGPQSPNDFNGSYSSAAYNGIRTTDKQDSTGTVQPELSATSVKTEAGQDQDDVLERIRMQLDDLTKALDSTSNNNQANRNPNAGSTANREEVSMVYQRNTVESHQVIPLEQKKLNDKLNLYQSRGDEVSFEGEKPAPTKNRGAVFTNQSNPGGLEFEGISNYANSQKKSSPLKEFQNLSQADISVEAKRIMGTHSSIESLSSSKFSRHMHEAEEHLKAGRYYRAAGCFSMASVYQPENPIALAGRGHALFAAGEYVSSALFLSRALAVNPQYPLVQVDLVTIFDDENKLADRITDIEQWQARSGSSQLQFLLGYVYYRTGQLLKAKQVIDVAYDKTSDSVAIQAMKITIDNAVTRR